MNTTAPSPTTSCTPASYVPSSYVPSSSGFRRVLVSLSLPVVMRGLALLDATATAAALGPEPTSGAAVVARRRGAAGARVA